MAHWIKTFSKSIIENWKQRIIFLGMINSLQSKTLLWKVLNRFETKD